MHNPHTWHPCLSPGSKHTSYRAPEMGDHDELPPPLEILLFFFVCSSGSWSLSLGSLNCCCRHIPSAVHPGSRCEKAGVRCGRKRRKGEVTRGSGGTVAHCVVGTVPSPEDWALGAPHHISAHLGHSCLLLGVKGRNLKFMFSLLICSGLHMYPHFLLCSSEMPPALHVAEVWVLFGGKEELAIKKVSLSQTTCMIYVMTDRHLIWFDLLGPFLPWRIESGFKAVEVFWGIVWNLEQKSWKSSCSCVDDTQKQNH